MAFLDVSQHVSEGKHGVAILDDLQIESRVHLRMGVKRQLFSWKSA